MHPMVVAFFYVIIKLKPYEYYTIITYYSGDDGLS